MEERIRQFIPDNIAQAICHTLVHSLWQGIILALLTGLIITLTKRSTAVMRYRLLAAELVLFAAVVVFTLVTELKNNVSTNFQITGSGGNPGVSIWDALLRGVNFALKYAHEHAGIIVIAWFLFLCVKSGRLIFGLYVIKRLKTVKIKPVSPFWNERARRLCTALNIRKTVVLLESGVAKIPLVIGYIKPVILIPVGLINALSEAEVEAILLHEFEHIRRNDYLVNLLQSIIEVLLFFNPAVLWLSYLLKVERENCCDDAAIKQTGNKIGYVQALVQFHEQSTKEDYAIAFTGNGKDLVRRLERMVYNKNRGLNRPEIITLFVLLLFSLLFIVTAPANNAHSLNTSSSTVTTRQSRGQAFEAKKKAEAVARTRKAGTSP